MQLCIVHMIRSSTRFVAYKALRASNLKAARVWAIKEELRELWSRESLDDALTLWRRWDAWAMRSRLLYKRLQQAFAWLAPEPGIGVVTGEPGVRGL